MSFYRIRCACLNWWQTEILSCLVWSLTPLPFPPPLKHTLIEFPAVVSWFLHSYFVGLKRFGKTTFRSHIFWFLIQHFLFHFRSAMRHSMPPPLMAQRAVPPNVRGPPPRGPTGQGPRGSLLGQPPGGFMRGPFDPRNMMNNTRPPFGTSGQCSHVAKYAGFSFYHFVLSSFFCTGHSKSIKWNNQY